MVALWILCLLVAFGFGYIGEEFFAFIIILLGVALTLVLFARSNVDDKLDIRTNVELIRLYSKSAYFLFIIVGILTLIFAVSRYIIAPYFL